MIQKYSFDVIIIGAGVIGLAIAERLSRSKSVLILEKESSFGQHTSSRNSEVIHSGIYYDDSLLKTSLCLEGKSLLYEYLQENNISHKKCGKLLVCNKNDNHKLEKYIKNAKERNINIEYKDSVDLDSYSFLNKNLEGILIKDTGILDSHSLMASLKNKIIENGAILEFNFNFTENDIYLNDLGEYSIYNKKENYLASSRMVINSSGLWANEVSEMFGIRNEKYHIDYVKGEYFKTNKLKNIEHLIYSIPKNLKMSLGVHTKNHLDGSISFGPNAYSVKDIKYDIYEQHKKEIQEELRDIFSIDFDDLYSDYAGIRPKLKTQVKDFIINKENDGFINLVGIESPGLTSCLSIARVVEKMVEK